MRKITNLLTAFLLTFLIASLVIPNGYSQTTVSKTIQKLDKCKTGKDSINVVSECIPKSQEKLLGDIVLSMSKFKDVSALKNYIVERTRLENKIPNDIDILFIDFEPNVNESAANTKIVFEVLGGVIIVGSVVLAIVSKKPSVLAFMLFGVYLAIASPSHDELLGTVTDDGSYFSIKIEGMNEDQRKELLALFRQDYENYMAKTATADSTETVEEAH